MPIKWGHVSGRSVLTYGLPAIKQEEIAGSVGVTKETVSEICQKSAELPESEQTWRFLPR
jgi:hypothetical protein